MLRYEIRLLGGFDVRIGETSVKPRTQKARAALAYLVLEAGKAVPRAMLAGLLWPDVQEKKAAQSLRQALSFIRQTLTNPQLPSPLTIDRQHVQLTLSPSCWADVAAFVNAAPFEIDDAMAVLTRQADLFNGELLAGFFVKQAPEFETYLVARREAFRATYLRALESLADFYLQRGEYEPALQVLQAAVETDPWHESAYRGLMRALALSGDHAAALAQYERARAALMEGLGVEPLPATQALYAQIRDGTLSPAADAVISSADHFPELAFSGRGEVHAKLVEALNGTIRSAPNKLSLVLVEGEAGAGKTRLVNEFNKYASSQGIALLGGRSYEFEAAMPYQALVDALRGFALTEPVAALPPAWQSEIGRLLPEIRTADLKAAPPLPAAGQAARQRLFEAVLQLLLIIARPAGLVVFLDDLQWADEATLALLQFLVRRSHDHPILYIGSYRPEEIAGQHPLILLQRSLSRERRSDVLALEPLDELALAAIAERVLGHPDPEFSAFLANESEGNPFVVAETLHSLKEQGQLRLEQGAWVLVGKPQASISVPLRDTIRTRAARLPEAAQKNFGLAAVIGRKFSFELLQATAGEHAGDDLDHWLQHRLVSATADGFFDFAHDKIREVVYQDLSGHQRQLLHGQVAKALLKLHAGDLRQASPALAHHFSKSQEPVLALPHLETAAQQAAAVLAFSAVASLCDQGLQLRPEAEQRFSFLDMRQRSSQFLGRTEAEGRDALAMRETAQRSQSAVQMAKAEERLALFYARSGDMDLARQAIESAVSAARESGKVALEIKALVPMAMLIRDTPGGLERAFDLLNYGLEHAQTKRNRSDEAFVLGHLGIINEERGQYLQALRHFEDSLVRLREVKDMSNTANCLYSMAGCLRTLGQFDRADRAVQEALDLAEELELGGIRLPILIGVGRLALERQDAAKAREAFSLALELANQFERPLMAGQAQLGLGQAARLIGDESEAHRWLSQAMERFDPADPRLLALARAELANAVRQTDHIQQAVALAGQAAKAVAAAQITFIEPQRIYWAYALALKANGDVDGARSWQLRAQDVIHEQAAVLEGEWRETFLDAVPINRKVLQTIF
jgi:DNA-binding SARP family transcriptional activator